MTNTRARLFLRFLGLLLALIFVGMGFAALPAITNARARLALKFLSLLLALIFASMGVVSILAVWDYLKADVIHKAFATSWISALTCCAIMCVLPVF